MNDYLGNARKHHLIPTILLAGLLVLGYWVVRELLAALAWALIISYVMWPAYRRLRLLLPDRPAISAAVMTTIITVVLLSVTYWLLGLLQNELKAAYTLVAGNVSQRPYQLPGIIRQIPWLNNATQGWLDKMGNDQSGMALQLANWLRQGAGEFARLMGGIGQHILKLGVVLVTVFFCFRDGDELVRQIRQGLLRFLGDYQHIYLQAAGDTARAVVYGLTLAAMGQGVLAGIGYAMVDLQAPVLLGVITALLALAPMGATLVWLPMGLALVFTGQPWQGFGLLLWGVLVVSTIDNVIRPLVISGTGRVPFLLVLFGVLGGLAAFGAIGLFLGPIILAVLLAVWRVWLEQ